jgi:hypothetical protein
VERHHGVQDDEEPPAPVLKALPVSNINTGAASATKLPIVVEEPKKRGRLHKKHVEAIGPTGDSTPAVDTMGRNSLQSQVVPRPKPRPVGKKNTAPIDFDNIPPYEGLITRKRARTDKSTNPENPEVHYGNPKKKAKSSS